MEKERRDGLYARIEGTREWERNFRTLKFNEYQVGIISKEEYERVTNEAKEYTDDLIERINKDLAK